MTTLNRILDIRPAWDKRDLDPAKNYGIHGVDMIWTVQGPLGAIYFSLFTGWMLPHVEKEMELRDNGNRITFSISRPQPASIGYHSPKPFYEGQEPQPCHLLPGGQCYADCSFCAAEDVFEILVREGGEALWLHLENEYHSRFGAT